ncbi:alpha-L-fucosidase [Lachnoclostridium phytofermentans]
MHACTEKRENMYQFNRDDYNKRMEWYQDARFGMFIHWGLYSIPARGEWLRSTEEMSIEDYQKYFDEFDARDYDPKKWAKLAKEAGMKYVVLTAKHHDGFCLFDSKYTEYKATNTKAGRDLVKEYVDAVRAEGLKVGLYFTLLDWYHEDYPHYGDRIHPMRNNKNCGNENRDFSRYVEYFHKQVEEICTNYGQLDVLWFDFSYDDMRGEKWGATKLMNMVRTLQPQVIIDNRLEASGEGKGSLAEGNPTPYHGDFVSPEQIIPPEGVKDVNGDPLVWEACITMNNNWGYHGTDKFFKPAPMLIKKLVECVSKGGNMLLNVGPDAYGNIPEESVEILSQIGKWMKRNHDSIYGCGIANVPKPDYGRVTRKGNKYYFHMFENTIGPVPLLGLEKNKVKKIRALATGYEIPISTSWVHSDYPDIVFANLGPNPVLPDNIDYVLEVEMDD